MRSPALAAFGLVSLFALAGCPVNHQSPPARAAEAAHDLNLNTRFGRMHIATSMVAAEARSSFLERRRAWGGNVRIVDFEMQGVKMRGDSDADIFVRVAWQRMDEGDLRTTLLQQNWHDFKGTFQLVGEHRADGDVGLLGEPRPQPAPGEGPERRPAHFPTIRLGEGGG